MLNDTKAASASNLNVRSLSGTQPDCSDADLMPTTKRAATTEDTIMATAANHPKEAESSTQKHGNFEKELPESNVSFGPDMPSMGRKGILWPAGPRGYRKTSNFSGAVVVGGNGILGDGDPRFVYVALRRNPNTHGRSGYIDSGKQLTDLVKEIGEIMNGMPLDREVDEDEDFDLAAEYPLVYGPGLDMGPYGKVPFMNMGPNVELHVAVENTYWGLQNLQWQLMSLDDSDPFMTPFTARAFPDSKRAANGVISRMVNDLDLAAFIIPNNCFGVFQAEDVVVVDHDVMPQQGDFICSKEGLFRLNTTPKLARSRRQYNVVTSRLRVIENADGFCLDVAFFRSAEEEPKAIATPA